VHYIDGEGSIIVPKSVRPIIDYKETSLGNKKGAKREFRYGNLHIREYDDNYIVHRDNIDPKEDALGHLLSDAPEYLAGTISVAFVGYKVGQEVYDRSKAKGKNQRTALYDAILAGFLAGSTTAGSVSSYIFTNTIRKGRST
jgi:hypothetical protein